MSSEENLAGSVLISTSWDSTRITGSLPDEFNISLESEYSNPLQGVSSEALQAVMQSATGNSLYLNNDAFHIWMGSHPLQLSWDMTLVAQSSFSVDLVDPMRQLMKLVTARASGQDDMLLDPPVPKGQRISVMFGNILWLPDVLITNVSPTPSRPLLVGGFPAKIPISVTIRTKRIMTTAQVDKWFFPGYVSTDS